MLINVAADPLYILYRVNGGLVIVSADDPGMHSSQNEQDNGVMANLPSCPLWNHPIVRWPGLYFLAFDISEEFDTPVMLRVTTRLSHSQTLVEEGEPGERVLKEYKKDAPKYVMLPGYARGRHVEVEKRMVKLAEYAETTPLNRIEWGDRSLGIITSGVAYQYVREALPNVSVLKLGLVNPLPKNLIASFAQQVERLVVVEELEGH